MHRSPNLLLPGACEIALIGPHEPKRSVGDLTKLSSRGRLAMLTPIMSLRCSALLILPLTWTSAGLAQGQVLDAPKGDTNRDREVIPDDQQTVPPVENDAAKETKNDSPSEVETSNETDLPSDLSESEPAEIETSDDASAGPAAELDPEATSSATQTSPTVPLGETPPNPEAATNEYESSSLPQEPERVTPWLYRQGRIRFGAGFGWTSTSNESWTILSAGLGVFPWDGVLVELDSTFWLGGSPFVATLTPGLRYVFHFVPTVQPYVGGFYRHYFLGDGYPDTDSVGARAGVYFMIGQHLLIGGGAAYEHFVNEAVFVRQDDVYPELTFSLVF